MSQLYRHRNKGSVYEVLSHTAWAKASKGPFIEDFDDTLWTVYKDTETGQIYVRPTKVFMDGRFEQLYSEQTGGAG